jgi:hypothetical protein
MFWVMIGHVNTVLSVVVSALAIVGFLTSRG